MKYSTHTSIHTCSHFGADTMFLFQAHTHSHLWTLWAARSFLLLGNPSLFHKESTRRATLDVSASTHHSRPMLIPPLVVLLCSPGRNEPPIFCMIGKQANLTVQPQPPVTSAPTKYQKIGYYSLPVWISYIVKNCFCFDHLSVHVFTCPSKRFTSYICV